MVWSFSYRPKPDVYPDAEVLEGNDGELALFDDTPDGGAFLQKGSFSKDFSGRQVRPESVPTKIVWKSSRPFLDFERVILKTVSERFRDLIEKLEPDTHQFVPVQFVSKKKVALGTRWFWQICSRLDSVDRERTDWQLAGGVWIPPDHIPKEERVGVVFDVARIGAAKFWHDKHHSANLCSDSAHDAIVEAKITGIHFRHRNSA